MDYLLKSSALLIVFYLCYQLFLKRETFFESNRWFLLSGLIIAISFPLIVIPHYIEYSLTATSGFMVNSSLASNIPMAKVEEPFDYFQLFFWLYVAGTVFFSGKLILEFLSLQRILNNVTVNSNTKYKFMETSEIIAPFSFFNRIVYNPNQFATEELAHVINHEKVHAQQYHSVDTIIAQLTCVLFWFNPIVWLYKKAVQQNLEFIADQRAQYISPCNKSYQTVLLKTSVTNHHLKITNNFYTSLIKKRIIMLHKSKSKPINRLKLFIILPLLALFMMSFNVKNVYIEIPIEDTNIFDIPIQQSKVIEIIIRKDTSDDELNDMKTSLNDLGISFTYSGLKRNSIGEITAITTSFEGKDHSANFSLSGDDPIQPFRFKSDNGTFSVGSINKGKNSFIHQSSDGKTKVQTSGSNSNVYVLESEDNEGSEDVIFNFKNSQDSNEVFLKKTSSGSTWISNDGTKTSINASENGNSNVFISQSDEPLFIINGKAVSKSLFEDVDSDDIKSINVLNGKSAVKVYGGKGKNGVVVMTTNNSKSLFNNNKNATFYHFDTDEESPIYVINGEVIEQEDMSKIDPNVIESIEILKDEKATQIYGSKGKNGAVIVTSKNGNSQIIQAQPVLIEGQHSFFESDSPRKIKSTTASVYFVDDKSIETVELVISKHSTDAFLDQQKNTLKSSGIDAKFSKIRRNRAGEITSIKISLDDNKGRKSSASWKEKEQAIPDIVLGKSGDKLFVRAIGN